MPLSIIEGDVYVNGSLTSQTFTAPTGSVSDDSIEAGAGVEASKLQHQHEPVCVLCDHASDAAALRKVIHRVKGATATIVQFGAGATVAAGSSSSATVTLRKNGTVILSASITLDNTVSVNTLATPIGFASTALVQGDVLEAEITAVAGANKPKGVYAQLTVREDA